MVREFLGLSENGSSSGEEKVSAIVSRRIGATNELKEEEVPCLAPLDQS